MHLSYSLASDPGRVYRRETVIVKRILHNIYKDKAHYIIDELSHDPIIRATLLDVDRIKQAGGTVPSSDEYWNETILAAAQIFYKHDPRISSFRK